jgi:hypothetical protein
MKKKLSLGVLVIFVISFVVSIFALAETADGLSRVSLHGWNNTAWAPVNLDRASRALESITFEHHLVHDGASYTYSDVLSLNGTQDYLITTPDTTTWGHFTYEVDTTGATEIDLYESADRNGTTAQTIYNRDRNSANTATITVHKNQSGGTTDGTKILYKSTALRAATYASEANERILKRNTKYIFRLVTGGAQTVSIVLNWYEWANKT